MTPRFDYFKAAPTTMKGMLALEQAVRTSGLEYSLIELVKTRASQINGCAFCLHMHTRDARAAGEREERLHLLVAWRESSYFTPREQAALAWTEALTRLADGPPADHLYDALSAQFTEEEMTNLTLLIGAINVWNRIAVGFHSAHPEAWSPADAA